MRAGLIARPYSQKHAAEGKSLQASTPLPWTLSLYPRTAECTPVSHSQDAAGGERGGPAREHRGRLRHLLQREAAEDARCGAAGVRHAAGIPHGQHRALPGDVHVSSGMPLCGKRRRRMLCADPQAPGMLHACSTASFVLCLQALLASSVRTRQKQPTPQHTSLLLIFLARKLVV